METMMLMPPAVAATSSARHAIPSYVIVPETFGALPTMAASAGHVCTWSLTTYGNETHQAAKGIKSFGTRRLVEKPT